MAERAIAHTAARDLLTVAGRHPVMQSNLIAIRSCTDRDAECYVWHITGYLAALLCTEQLPPDTHREICRRHVIEDAARMLEQGDA